MSERSPGFTASAAAYDETNASMPASVSSAPRGSLVVPLVNMIMETREVSTPSASQTLACGWRSPRTLSRKRSVLIEPKPPVLRSGQSARTACAFSQWRAE